LAEGADPFTYSKKCTIYEDMGIDVSTTKATIPKVVKNPCAAQNIIAVVAKAGVTLNAYQADEFVKWATATKEFIRIGMPIADVKECVRAKIPELNERIGIDFVTMSDILDALPDEAKVQEDDYKILIASIDDLIKQISEMKSQEFTATAIYLHTGRFRS